MIGLLTVLTNHNQLCLSVTKLAVSKLLPHFKHFKINRESFLAFELH